MEGHCYDGITWDANKGNVTLFEVKTAKYSSYPDFLKKCELDKAINKAFLPDCARAMKCSNPKYFYKLLVTDQVMYSDVVDALVAHAAEYDPDVCSVENVQACRR